MLLLLLIYVVLRALWKIDVHLISTLLNKSLFYYYYNLIRYGTSENILKTRTLNGAFWPHLKQFETAEKKMKSRTIINGAFWRYLKRFGTAEIILTQGRFRVHYCDTFWNNIGNCHEKKQDMLWPYKGCEVGREPAILDLKTGVGALWCCLKR